MDAGCAHVKFTPSAGACLPALDPRAWLLGVPHAVRDAENGETLVKSVLAAMFGQRGLKVRSWAGSDLQDGDDGATLDAPAAARSKIALVLDLVRVTALAARRGDGTGDLMSATLAPSPVRPTDIAELIRLPPRSRSPRTAPRGRCRAAPNSRT
ncbi:hypothetical protein ACFVYD_10875 [Streptomyces sp. NPDC058301]|uniref:hypothetical protein n=1 Tax=Streptomyces sp. NPDC058301 TaxID=3346436 RepID=UPI0036E029BB